MMRFEKIFYSEGLFSPFQLASITADPPNKDHEQGDKDNGESSVTRDNAGTRVPARFLDFLQRKVLLLDEEVETAKLGPRYVVLPSQNHRELLALR